MTQTLLTPAIIAKTALIVLENNTVMANLVHRDYSSEFKKVGATVTIRNPATFTATAFSTTVAVQEIVESSVQVVLDQHLDITVEITSQELTLNIVDFAEQVLNPQMRAMADKVDTLLTALYADIAGHTPVSATPAVSDIANLRAQLNIQKVPFGDRRCVLHPVTEARYVPLDSFLNADKRASPLTIKEAALGRIMGMDFYMDQNMASHDGDIVDVAGAMKGSATAGATAATVDALTDAEIIAAGDVFKVAGSDRGYLIVTGGTISSNEQAITFTPALDVAIADNAVVTFQADHDASLAFHKNAFALVSAPLEPPLGGARAAVANYKGLSCRVVYDYTMSNKKNTMSVDFLCGVKTLDKELAARLCDAQ
jgi:hypothetical protein